MIEYESVCGCKWLKVVTDPCSRHFTDKQEDGPTKYGFRWGPFKVDRIAHIEKRGYVIQIQTATRELQVFVSEKGYKIEPMEVKRR